MVVPAMRKQILQTKDFNLLILVIVNQNIVGPLKLKDGEGHSGHYKKCVD